MALGIWVWGLLCLGGVCGVGRFAGGRPCTRLRFLLEKRNLRAKKTFMGLQVVGWGVGLKSGGIC